MGTRSLTRVFDDDNKEILCMYRQFDGYIDGGHGMELAASLTGLTEVNGISFDDTDVFNGMGCLAAQIVAMFKREIGGFYLHRPGTSDVGEEYVYEVRSGGVGEEPLISVKVGYGRDASSWTALAGPIRASEFYEVALKAEETMREAA